MYKYGIQSPRWYRLRLLNPSPNLQNTQGIGANNIVTNPSKLVAHPTPNLSYIFNANNGNTAASVYLSNEFAPDALAPYNAPYVSIKYNPAGT